MKKTSSRRLGCLPLKQRSSVILWIERIHFIRFSMGKFFFLIHAVCFISLSSNKNWPHSACGSTQTAEKFKSFFFSAKGKTKNQDVRVPVSSRRVILRKTHTQLQWNKVRHSLEGWGWVDWGGSRTLRFFPRSLNSWLCVWFSACWAFCTDLTHSVSFLVCR